MLKKLIKKYDEKCIKLSIPFILMGLDALDKIRYAKIRYALENRMEEANKLNKSKPNRWIRRDK